MIEELLKRNEGKTLEFKENLSSMQGIIKTIIAFTNTAGGTIVIGVEDKTKKIIGLSNILLEEERIANSIHELISPALMPDIEIQTHRNKDLIIINVPHAIGPYHLKALGVEKGTYVRLGSTNRAADDDTIQSLKSFATNKYYDETPHIKGKVTDLDWDAIKELFKSVNKKITPQVAHNLGLITQLGAKEYPTFGGIILFGKNRFRLFPEALIRCARFIGNDRGGQILDQTTIESYLPLAIDQAINFVQRNTRLASVFSGLSRRKDIPEYPPEAIREAILNAIAHADYAVKGVFISIAIFDEHIEITNPGSLPFGFTLEKALAGSSKIRNRVIAKVFNHLKWIEQWGRGIGLIIRSCEQYGIKEPHFEEINNQFRVTLYSTKKQAIKARAKIKKHIKTLEK